MSVNRRTFLKAGTFIALGTTTVAKTTRTALGQSLTMLDVAYAGSMSSIMEGPLKQLAAQRLSINLQGRAQGATGLAQLIASGSISPDVFISVTPSPIGIVIKAGKLDVAFPIARTEMVIAYGPKSTFAPKFASSYRNGAEPWWQILLEGGIRFGRTDPVSDPSGRNTIYVMQLTARFYKRPDLAAGILGPDINPSQIFTEATIEARLQSGELDAASVYKIQPAAFELPFISLPDAINLSDPQRQADYAQASVTINGRVLHPEPLVYYAAVLKEAAHPKEAVAFVRWLSGPEAQAVFRRYSYASAGNAVPLHP